ncbi:dephospho-CoA kinase [Gordonia sinesedis]
MGLTGGIGAGKSTVATTFADRSAYLIDADKVAREVVEPGTEGLARLVEAFGDDILTADGTLDRPALAARAFVDDEQRQKLNAITHPLIGARTQQMLDDAPADAIVVQDIPLLVENNTAPFFHLVVIVHADTDLRVRRLTTARGMAADDARARIAAQATEEQRRAVADIWLDNSGTPDDLGRAAAEVWERRLVPFERNVRAGTPAPGDPELVAADPNPATRPQRVVSRLWAVLGDRAAAITVDDPDAVTISVRPAGSARPDTANVLAAGGFPPVPGTSGQYRSADPGRPAEVTVHTG